MGSFVWDVIHGRDPRELPVEEWGGITYALGALDASLPDDWEIVPTRVRRGAAIGANATIVCGVTLGPYCMVGAGSTVTHDVPPHALVVGSPARVVSYICRRGHRMEPDNPLDYESSYRCIQCGELLQVTVLVSWIEPVK